MVADSSFLSFHCWARTHARTHAPTARPGPGTPDPQSPCCCTWSPAGSLACLEFFIATTGRDDDNDDGAEGQREHEQISARRWIITAKTRLCSLCDEATCCAGSPLDRAAGTCMQMPGRRACGHADGSPSEGGRWTRQTLNITRYVCHAHRRLGRIGPWMQSSCICAIRSRFSYPFCPGWTNTHTARREHGHSQRSRAAAPPRSSGRSPPPR